MNPINPSRYGSQKPIDRKSNVEALYKIFREKKDKELIDLEANKFNNLKKKYTKTQAIKFFDGLITQDRQHITMNAALMDQLSETGRLIPEYCDTKYKKVYSGIQLIEYYLESKPR